MLFSNISFINDNYVLQKGGYIQTEGDKIVYVGSSAPKNYTGESINGENKLAMPGFFNIHSHVPMVLVRGFGEGLPLQRWLFERMFPFEALLTGEDMYWGALLGISEMIKSGAVSFTDMYMKMEHICKAVEESGIKANLSNGSSGKADQHFKDTNGWADAEYLLNYRKANPSSRIIADASIHAEYTSDALLCREVAEFAKENNLRMHLHISETKKEHEECKQRRGGMTPAQWFNSLGVLDVPATAAHCVWAEDNDFEIFAEKGVTVAHCPSSNLKLGSGIARVKTMMDMGVNVGIGTDGAASNNNLNVLEEVTLASLLQKGASQDPLFMGTAQTLEVACRSGAMAQGRADCGSIKAGNKADIVLYDTDRPEMQPKHDILANLLYSAGSDSVVLSMIDGKIVYKNGEFTSIDIEKVKYHVNRIAEEKVKALNL